MVNLVVLAGNLCAAPDLKYIASGTAVCNLRLAVNNKYTTASGDKRESVLFIDVTAWGKQAESAAEYLEKGSKILVEGELRQREWTDTRSGDKRSKIEVQCRSIQFLSMKKSNGAHPATSPTHAPADADADVPF